VQRSRTKRRVGPTKTGRTRLVSVLHPVCEDTPAWQPGATPESRSVLAGLQRLPVASLELDGDLFGRRLDEHWLHRLWRRVLTKAGVRYREVEQLRHTFASTLLSRNAPCSTWPSRAAGKTPGCCSSTMPGGCPKPWPNRPQPRRNRGPESRAKCP